MSYFVEKTEETKRQQWFFDFSKHVLDCYPNEACGILVDNEFLPVTNIHTDPANAFTLNPIQVINHDYTMILHSHPYDINNKSVFEGGFYDPVWPSYSDQVHWMMRDIPWLISSCDGEAVSNPIILDDNDNRPLLGRPFIWGYNDCWGVVRDWYRSSGLSMPNIARKWGFWRDNEQPFLENFEKFGFHEIRKSDMDVGDILLFRLNHSGDSINHCAVIVGSNKLLTHHPGQVYHSGRLSEIVSLGDWADLSCMALRFGGSNVEDRTHLRTLGREQEAPDPKSRLRQPQATDQCVAV